MRAHRPTFRLTSIVAATLPLAVVLAACGSDASSGSSPTTAAAAAAAPGGTAAAVGTSSSSIPSELRDLRYCEVIPSVDGNGSTTTYVYNTLGQNLCPSEKWNQLTEDEVNEAYGSQSAELNGPRHWVLDSLDASGATASGQTFTFGGIEMNLRATLTTPAGQATVGNQLYTPNEVARDTIWVYDAGRKIYKLTDPDGNVYVMQSYSQSADTTLTIKQLDDLADKLTLPAGWSYSTETIDQELQLNSNGLATVVNDNLYNSYQRMG